MTSFLTYMESTEAGAVLVFGGLACSVLCLILAIREFRAARAQHEKWLNDWR